LKRPERQIANAGAVLMETAGDGRRARAFELDALRGLALFMMLLHHLIFDLRYMMGIDVFAFQETWWFENLLRPLFLNVFLIVSGICCSFSRSNTKRGLRLLAVAVGFTIVTSLASVWTHTDLYIIFNVLHLLAVGTLLYAALNQPEKRRGQRLIGVDVALLILMGVTLWLASLLPHWQSAGNYWLLPLGLYPADRIGMADYLPLIPWLGFFLMGALIGRVAYAKGCSAFPNAPGWLVATARPFGFIGKHSLLIYALHQPIFLAVLYGLRAWGLI
jgi:uncharacterized membrane protein